MIIFKVVFMSILISCRADDDDDEWSAFGGLPDMSARSMRPSSFAQFPTIAFQPFPSMKMPSLSSPAAFPSFASPSAKISSFADTFREFQEQFNSGGKSRGSQKSERLTAPESSIGGSSFGCQFACLPPVMNTGNCDCSKASSEMSTGSGIKFSQFPAMSTNFLADADINQFTTKFPTLDKDFLNNAFSSAFFKSSALFGQSDLVKFPALKPLDSPGSLSGAFAFTRPETVQNTLNAFTLEELSRSLSSQLNLNANEVSSKLSELTVDGKNCSVPDDTPVMSLDNPFVNVAKLPPCARGKYRSIDGSCNNPAFPNRGKVSTNYMRFVPSAYNDGIAVPRRAKSGNELPSPRLVSTTVVGVQNNPSNVYTQLLANFGQFLAHDLTSAPSVKLANGQAPECCKPDTSHPECFPVAIPANDRFYSRISPRQTCMEFVRSVQGTPPGCTLGAREQLNQLSSFIDGAQIYGDSANRVNALREKRGGLLKVAKTNGRYILPPPGPSPCVEVNTTKPCFHAGDPRLHVQIGLTVLHVMFLRHHNNIARGLQAVNPSWNDETLYQEARAIVVAQLQHITYNEFLPVLLGRDRLAEQGLELLTSGHFDGYDINTNPATSNEFAAAAFRIGHTMIPSNYRHMSGMGQPTGTVTRVQNTFFKSTQMYRENTADELLHGMCTDPGKLAQNHVVTDLSEMLYINKETFGLDLVSMNIQRGRDHGFPGYMQYRAACNLPTASSFQKLRALGVLNEGVADSFQSLYEKVEDIDLYIGGISEQPLPGAVVGPTFSCIISDQFRRLRAGDRFWYENGLPVKSQLNDVQLAEIRKTTLARIFCDTNILAQQTQLWVFQAVSDQNTLTPCSDIPSIDLGAWISASA